jgi:hypothetical protein
MSRSISSAVTPAFSMARLAASADILVVVSSFTRWRSLIPVRVLIHSSEVSIIFAKSSFVTIVAGRQLPVPIILVPISILVKYIDFMRLETHP